MLALGGEVGDVLAVGSELIRIDAPGLPDQPMPAPRKPAAAKAIIEPLPPPVERAAGAAARPGAAAAGPPRAAGERPLASPAVRLRARESGVDLRQVRGSGPAGRITHDDLSAFLEAPAPRPAQARAPNQSRSRRSRSSACAAASRRTWRNPRAASPISPMSRKWTSPRSKKRAPPSTPGANEARPRLTMLPFLMLGIVKAVAEFPQVNAHYDDEADVIRRFGAVHLGVATQTPAGLTVPVVRHAETLGLFEAAREMKRVTEAARAGIGAREEMSGSTITLTSLGAARRHRLDAGRSTGRRSPSSASTRSW